jgi:hypothetical protein
MNTDRMNGFDAYEKAWDVMAKRFWSLLGYNLGWFASAVAVVALILLLTVVAFKSWSAFFILAFFLFLVLSPLWEAANIVRYGTDSPSQTAELPVTKIILARLIFLLVVIPAYLIFILPGIYLHCRLALYLPLLVFTPGLSSMGSISKSWSLTRSRFVDFYTLWIAVVVSKPACLLPFGLGFLLERPASGLAKALMFASCSNRPRDRPP